MAITLRFLGQGLQTDGNSTGNVLIESLQDDGFSSFTSFVAWAGLAGIDQLREHIQSSNISSWNIFLGIDLKGTSKEALEALLELEVNTKIFYTVTPVTYHPKIYLFEGEQKNRVIIGSSNVTERGLFNNIEGGVIIDITNPDEQGSGFIQEIKDYFSSFLNGENPNVHELTNSLIESLREQGLIPNEQERRQSHERSSEESASSTTTREATRTLFPSITMQRSPQRRRQQPQTAQEREIPQNTTTVPTQTTQQITPIQEGFYKKLSHYDASSRSSPGQMIIPIGNLNFLPPFTNFTTHSQGAQQSENFFDVIFESSTGERTRVNRVRTILYVPAPTHPRPNREIRFTFLNNEIFEQLHEDDILEFRRTNNSDVRFIIRHITPAMAEYQNYPGRMGQIPIRTNDLSDFFN